MFSCNCLRTSPVPQPTSPMLRGDRSFSSSMRKIPLAFHPESSACHCGTLRRYSPFRKTFLDVGAVVAVSMVVPALPIGGKTQAGRRLAGLNISFGLEEAEQVLPQLMPAGLEVTVPMPRSVLLTVRVNFCCWTV